MAPQSESLQKTLLIARLCIARRGRFTRHSEMDRAAAVSSSAASVSAVPSSPTAFRALCANSGPLLDTLISDCCRRTTPALGGYDGREGRRPSVASDAIAYGAQRNLFGIYMESQIHAKSLQGFKVKPDESRYAYDVACLKPEATRYEHCKAQLY